MAIMTKKEFGDKINELVGGDMFAGGNDRNPTNNSEIETGPVVKTYDDDSDYEKGQATTSDRVFGRYRQNIPWFAVYSYGGRRSQGGIITFESENKNVIVTKKTVEEKIEDLVKKSKSSEVTSKDYNPKVAKIMDTINDIDLTDKQLEELEKAINDKKLKKETSKNL